MKTPEKPETHPHVSTEWAHSRVPQVSSQGMALLRMEAGTTFVSMGKWIVFISMSHKNQLQMGYRWNLNEKFKWEFLLIKTHLKGREKRRHKTETDVCKIFDILDKDLGLGSRTYQEILKSEWGKSNNLIGKMGKGHEKAFPEEESCTVNTSLRRI